MDSRYHLAKTSIIKAALAGAVAGVFVAVLWLAIETPWLEPRQKETWPQWIGFLVLLLPAAVGGAWIGGGAASAITFLIQAGKGRVSRALALWTLGLLVLWASVMILFIKRYNPYTISTPVSAGDRSPRAVGRQLSDERIPEMIAALEDPDPQVRCLAASSLFSVRRPELAHGAVVKLLALTKDTSPCSRGAAIETLGRLAPGEDRVLLAARILLDDNDEDVKWRAANALVECSCKGSLDVHFMDDLLLSPGYSMNVKTRLVRVAGCQNENGFGILEGLLSSRDEHVQKEAIIETSRIIARDPGAPASGIAFDALKNLSPASDSARRLRDSAVQRYEMIRSRQLKERNANL